MYLLIFVFFSVKELGNWRKEKNNKKTKEEIFEERDRVDNERRNS